MRWVRPWLGFIGVLGVLGCNRAARPVPGSQLPAHFPAAVYAPDQNRPDTAAFALGRALFYDARLSADGRVSCGSCHRQAAAFADAGQAFSRGVGGQVGPRNTPALQNLRWKTNFLADGGASHIETMPLAPLTNPREMGTTLPVLLRTLNADAAYRRRFARLYGPGPIDTYRFLRTLAQFTAALTSADTRYDQVLRHQPGAALTAAEQRGLRVVERKCAGCHGGVLFTDETVRNNGLDAAFPVDSGRAHITDSPRHRGLFKVPSLRHVTLTAPYMHDGRFRTLRQVLDHYDRGVVASATLDPLLRPAGRRPGIPLSEADKRDILAFLATLTDTAFLRNPELAAPHRQ